MAEQSRYEALKTFLKDDPHNPSLLADVADAATKEGDIAFALECFETLHSVDVLTGGLANSAGIVAMRAGRQDLAQQWYAAATEGGNAQDVALDFNIAYSMALDGDFEGAIDKLGPEVIEALPQAALLDLQIHHQLGLFEQAEAKMETYFEKYPDYGPLQAAVSVLAMDVDRPELARTAAQNAGDHPDALTTLGTLSLAEHKVDYADAAFEKALATGHKNPRALVGRGMVALARGQNQSAAEALDKGAEQFGDHLGSWIAAGWAYALANDLQTARARFERAKSIDDTFGEAHGSLAVLDFLAGDIEGAQRGAKVGRRLDPQSFSSALVQILIARSQGKAEMAEAILESALSTEVLPNGQTLRDAILGSVR